MSNLWPFSSPVARPKFFISICDWYFWIAFQNGACKHPMHRLQKFTRIAIHLFHPLTHCLEARVGIHFINQFHFFPRYVLLFSPAPSFLPPQPSDPEALNLGNWKSSIKNKLSLYCLSSTPHPLSTIFLNFINLYRVYWSACVLNNQFPIDSSASFFPNTFSFINHKCNS